MSYDPNDLLMGSGIPAAVFPNRGDIVKGTIARITATQQTDFQTKAPLFYEDGNPRMQIVVTLRTDLRDPEITHDDGQRKLYVKGQMQQAIRAAVIAAEAEGLEDGGTLAVQWADEKAPERRGNNPQKIYVAQYRPPQRAGDLLGIGNGAQQPQPAPQAAQTYTPPPVAPQPAGSLFEPQQSAPAVGGHGGQPAPTTGTNLI
jgi:hypothetical protein